jgi:hypothetical protein
MGSDIKVNKVYQIKAPYIEGMAGYTQPLSWSGSKLAGSGKDIQEFQSLYSCWEKLDKQRVRVIKHYNKQDYFAKMENGPDVSFVVYGGFLTETDDKDAACICSIQKLMLTGCRCGAFQEELGCW